jgi:YidC/Oxa1 family membrane protein insertase
MQVALIACDLWIQQASLRFWASISRRIPLAELQNPNHQSGRQNVSTILALSLVFFLALLGVQAFQQKKPVEPKSKLSSTVIPAAPNTLEAAAQANQESIQASSESEIIVENKFYRIRFSNRGGQVLSWILKQYTDDSGKPLDLVNQRAASLQGYPLSLYTQNARLTKQLAEALYEPSASGRLVAPGKLTFTYSEGGVSVIKTFTFDQSYIVGADVLVTDHGMPVAASLCWPSGLGDQETLQNYNVDGRFDASLNGKFDSQTVKSIATGVVQTGSYDYVGVSDLYFAAIFLPEHSTETTVLNLRNEISIPRTNGQTHSALSDVVSVPGVAVGNGEGHIRLRLFAGPKAIELLSSVHALAPDGSPTGPDLEPLVRFGFLRVIAKPLFLALNWIHVHLVHSWGWAILLLTLFINLVLMPTRIKTMRSQLKMQRIQPQINAIRARFKDCKMGDPHLLEMNKEIFDLQKKEGINVFGGMLPLLLQMPLLYGFYRMLQNVVELRHAEWFWLHDLSSLDPLHVLPVFFVITMFLLQLLTPSSGTDPVQRKMTALGLPVLGFFMTWKVGAGLALYWSFGNVISIVQQVVVSRMRPVG